jgi:serine/threonine protein kinase
MKKEILNDFEQVQKRINICEMIQNIIKKTGSKGLINLYGNLYIKKLHIKKNNNLSLDDNNKEVQKNNNNIKYIYYELMEKAERDWDKEINSRSQLNLYYTQKEILDIMKQLIGVLSLLQKNHITHRDIKPQNILIINGKYKLSDYGEIRELKRDGLIVQRVRGSELYMSPILFHGLHLNILQVKHNTYKSDVFSLGMCLFYACSLTYSGVDSIREITDMNKIKEIVFQYLFKNYSTKLIYFILAMLEVDENKRLNFIQLEEKLKRFF